MPSLLKNSFTNKGILFGLLGTLVMSLVMLVGMGTSVSPLPEPIPLAIAKGFLGSTAKPIVTLFAIITHFGYGAFWGALLYNWTKADGTIWHGLGWSVMLWLIMELIVLPLLGWGLFGSAITPKIAAVTFLLHLIYGVILGWGLKRLSNA